MSKLEPNDLCLIWLCAIHLEAFSSLPSMVRCTSLLNSRVLKYFDTRAFWKLTANNKRVFNQNFFHRLSKIYARIEEMQVSFLHFKGQHICSLEKFNKNSKILFFLITLFAPCYYIRYSEIPFSSSDVSKNYLTI